MSSLFKLGKKDGKEKEEKVQVPSDDLEISRFSFSEVYCAEEPKVDVIFVHGLGGDPQRTWTGSKGVFWPAKVLPEGVDHVRILTYGYNADPAFFSNKAGSDNVMDHAHTLIAHLHALRNNKRHPARERPIIFVCHSLGGIVVKRALIYSAECSRTKNLEHLHGIFVSTYGILFLGTPHRGSPSASWGKMLQSICSTALPKAVLDHNHALVNTLMENSETLRNITDHFKGLTKNFHMYFFWESLKTSGINTFVVPQESAAPTELAEERSGIEADHSGICKFNSEKSPGYNLVEEALRRYSEQAPDVIASRWITAKRLMQEERVTEVFDAARVYGYDIKKNNEPFTANRRPDLVPVPKADDGKDIKFPVSLNKSTSTLTTHIEPFFVVPDWFTENSLFVGMESELAELDYYLVRRRKMQEKVSSVILWCVAGGGKTHLARQFIYTRRQDFPGGIFWVRAKSLEHLDQSFRQIAMHILLRDPKNKEISKAQIGAEPQVQPVTRWFESRQDWLLVVDGVNMMEDHQLLELRKFVPNGKHASILFTTRDQTLRQRQHLLHPSSVKVNRLSINEAKQLLFKELGIHRPTESDDDQAEKLVIRFQRHPQLIHDSARYMIGTGQSLKTYLAPFKVEPILPGLKQYSEVLGNLQDNAYHEALNLLNLLCFFDQHIPFEMIRMGARFLPPNVAIARKTPDGVDLDSSVKILIKYGILERSNVGQNEHLDELPALTHGSVDSGDSVDMLHIHGPWQDWCVQDLSKNRAWWLGWAAGLFMSSFYMADARIKKAVGYAHVEDYNQYVVHGDRLRRHAKFMKKRGEEVDEIIADLEKTIATIKKEIEEHSASSCEQIKADPGRGFQLSIFDKRSSSSDSSISSVEAALSETIPWFGHRVESPVYEGRPPLLELAKYEGTPADLQMSQVLHRLDETGSSPKWIYVKPATPLTGIQLAAVQGERYEKHLSKYPSIDADELSPAHKSLTDVHYSYVTSKLKDNKSHTRDSSGSEPGTSPRPSAAIPIKTGSFISDIFSFGRKRPVQSTPHSLPTGSVGMGSDEFSTPQATTDESPMSSPGVTFARPRPITVAPIYRSDTLRPPHSAGFSTNYNSVSVNPKSSASELSGSVANAPYDSPLPAQYVAHSMPEHSYLVQERNVGLGLHTVPEQDPTAHKRQTSGSLSGMGSWAQQSAQAKYQTGGLPSAGAGGVLANNRLLYFGDFPDPVDYDAKSAEIARLQGRPVTHHTARDFNTPDVDALDDLAEMRASWPAPAVSSAQSPTPRSGNRPFRSPQLGPTIRQPIPPPNTMSSSIISENVERASPPYPLGPSLMPSTHARSRSSSLGKWSDIRRSRGASPAKSASDGQNTVSDIVLEKEKHTLEDSHKEPSTPDLIFAADS